jgi:hypothetical protein
MRLDLILLDRWLSIVGLPWPPLTGFPCSYVLPKPSPSANSPRDIWGIELTLPAQPCTLRHRCVGSRKLSELSLSLITVVGKCVAHDRRLAYYPCGTYPLLAPSDFLAVGPWQPHAAILARIPATPPQAEAVSVLSISKPPVRKSASTCHAHCVTNYPPSLHVHRSYPSCRN